MSQLMMKRNRALAAVVLATLVGCRAAGTAGGLSTALAPRGEFADIWDAVPERPAAQPAAARRILVFSRSEGFQHQAIGATEAALRYMGEKTGAFEVTVSTDIDAFDAANLARFDAVVFNNTTRLTFENPDHRRALLAFVRGGKGVIGIHAATDNFYNWPEAAAMMGGLFDGHPWGAGGTWAVKVDEPEHVLCECFEGKGFLIKDEIYQMKDPVSGIGTSSVGQTRAQDPPRMFSWKMVSAAPAGLPCRSWRMKRGTSM